MKQRFDVTAVRSEFPVAERMLYLDSAHQTPLSAPVRAALASFYREGHENAGPKSVWLARVEKVRERVAAFLGASPDEIAFTKNTSEGLNIAANSLPMEQGDNVLMIEGDHPNNAYAFLNLQRKGIEVRFVPLSTEVADATTFAAHMNSRTKAVSLSHVTFHAGHRHDVADIGRLCREKGLYLVVDAMQSLGVVPMNVATLGTSLVAAGCHKGLLVPQGLGILHSNRCLEELQPAYLALASLADPPSDLIARPEAMRLRTGAGRFELGNYNLADIHALGAALDMILEVGIENILEHVLDLGDHLIEHMDRLGVDIVGPRARQHRAHIYVLDLPGEEWPAYLASEEVRISPERQGVRVSFALFNTVEDVERFAAIVRRRLQRLGASRNGARAT
jgi:cysteine desulfurase / selenocysteine lyase